MNKIITSVEVTVDMRQRVTEASACQGRLVSSTDIVLESTGSTDTFSN